MINLSQPVKPHYIPTQNSKGLESCQNKDSALHNEARHNHKEYVSVNTRSFTRSMDMVSIHVTMQQQKEPTLVEIESEDKYLSRIHEFTHNSDNHK